MSTSKTTREVEAETGVRPPNDPVDHPVHYNSHPSGVEAIEVCENLPFNIGNAIKYLFRHRLKHADDPCEDLRKALWYTKRELNSDEMRSLPTPTARDFERIGKVIRHESENVASAMMGLWSAGYAPVAEHSLGTAARAIQAEIERIDALPPQPKECVNAPRSNLQRMVKTIAVSQIAQAQREKEVLDEKRVTLEIKCAELEAELNAKPPLTVGGYEVECLIFYLDPVDGALKFKLDGHHILRDSAKIGACVQDGIAYAKSAAMARNAGRNTMSFPTFGPQFDALAAAIDSWANDLRHRSTYLIQPEPKD